MERVRVTGALPPVRASPPPARVFSADARVEKGPGASGASAGCRCAPGAAVKSGGACTAATSGTRLSGSSFIVLEAVSSGSGYVPVVNLIYVAPSFVLEYGLSDFVLR